MTFRHAIAIAALLSTANPALAQGPIQTLPAVQARVVLYVSDCGHRSLPSQAQVGEWTGQRNFAQVYDTRARLMAEIARACRKPGTEQVHWVAVRRGAPRSVNQRSVAVATPAVR